MRKNVLEYLEESARKSPDKIAFSDEKKSNSYREIEERAKRVGSALARKAPPRSPIPVLMEKGVDTMAAFLGAVYAGCFYVLLDRTQPKARLNTILKTLEAPVLVTLPEYKEQAETLDFSGEILSLDELEQESADEAILNAVQGQALDTDPLYGIFTSGSTGVPKGVVVGHRSVIDFIDCFVELFGITSEDVIGNQAPFDFDVSVKDIYTTLKTGATMEIIPKKYFAFPAELLNYICDRNVTTLIWAVSALCLITTLKGGLDYRVPSQLKRVMFSGEAMPVNHLNEWRRHLPDTMFVNLYGPTEITCNCAYYIVDREFAPGEALPMGRPFPNEKVFLLDEENRQVTESGCLGELCVAGTALSLGYYNNPEATAKAFVQNPLNSRYLEPIYRTGDLAYYGEDGLLVFASRKDFQIKHMGHRIELGEIEAAMGAIPGIVRACCTYDEKKQHIIAHYVGEGEKRQIAKALLQWIPKYMLPNEYRRWDQLPVNVNGKVNYRLLREGQEGGQ
ncbi:amino acid adenylation domain-containing protein [Hominifimenecus sp. rT4P-3]|uniref:amino acid adenylation domain-containing protein n=1 Tax=Hominifimenecus sp. rT4P-3 TaxID=3242979 RepID=UPI003DA4ED84